MTVIHMTLEGGELATRTNDGERWDHYAYQVTLHIGDRSTTAPFRTGTAWTAPPNIGDVMVCLAQDALMTAEDADDMGLTPTQWERARTATEALAAFFGPELLELFEVIDAEQWEGQTGDSVDIDAMIAERRTT